MSRDQLIGWLLVVVSAVVIIVYTWLLFLPPKGLTVLGMPIDQFLIKLTAWLAVALVFGLLGWIGYTLATTPPPKPIEEIEKEIEEELKKLEKELKESEKKEEATGGGEEKTSGASAAGSTASK